MKKLLYSLLMFLGLQVSAYAADEDPIVEGFETMPVFEADTTGVEGTVSTWSFIRSHVAAITDGVEGTGAKAVVLGSNSPSLVLDSCSSSVGSITFTAYNSGSSTAKLVLYSKAPGATKWVQQANSSGSKTNSISASKKVTVTYEMQFDRGTSIRFNLSAGSNCYIDDVTFAAGAPEPEPEPEEETAGPDPITSPYWGYWMGTNVSELQGLGTGQTTNYVAIYVPGGDILSGAQIRGVRVPVKNASVVKSISVWCTKNLVNTTTFDRKIKLASVQTGINQVAFTEPLDIPAEGCFVGYTITVNSTSTDDGAYHIAVADGDQSNGLYIYYQGQWYDFANQGYGCSALQASLNVDFVQPDYAATFGTVANTITQVNTTTTWKLPVVSNGSKTVTSIDYTIQVGDQTETRHANVAIAAGFGKTGYVNVDVTSPAEVGAYNVNLAITKVNGQDNSLASNVTTIKFDNISRLVPRNVVVEEFTGTGCGYCPYGIQGMANMRDAHPDRFIGLAFHKYNASDPMYPNYASASSLGINSAPSLALDRKVSLHAYSGSSKNSRYIVQDFEDYMGIPAEVDLSLDAKWTDDSKTSVQLNVTAEAVVADNYRIVYALVADSLTANVARWKQTNYLYSYAASQLPADMARFASGGQYGQSSFYFPFDDVVISSSYSSNEVNQAPALGNIKLDQTVTASYTLDLPTNDTYKLKTAVRNSIDKVYAIAFVLTSQGTVAQGVKVHVQEVATSGIHEVSADQAAPALAPAYDLQGRQLSAPRQGQLFIQNGEKKVIR